MSRQPDPWKSLRDEFRKLQDQIRRMQAASPFFGTGFHPNGNNGIESDDFDGDLDAGNAGTKGWAFNSARAAIGELFLRPGSVTNDALAQPVIPGAANRNSNTFALTPTFSEIVGVDVTVPAGCTSALINVSVWVQAYNANTTGGSDGVGSDYLYIYAKIGATSGQYNATGISGSGGTTTGSGGLALSLTGLTPGSTVRLGGWGSSQYTTLAASAYNTGTLTASLTWLR